MIIRIAIASGFWYNYKKHNYSEKKNSFQILKHRNLYMWHVYIIKCRDNSFYSGITVDLERRIKEHNEGGKGAKYTRARRPVKLVYKKRYRSRASASREEARIKNLNRQEKEDLISKI